MIHIKENKCDFCGTCVAVCPVDAIEMAEADLKIIHETCIDCDICVWICPIDVLESRENPEEEVVND
ncbi:MAG: 4Fe-4S binding protein [Candidatus Marinimicrobia bacterium]|nr:4Fe-4S binding protein [Candidatus Neomarinimicrobiota bacterium]MCF7840399.1 4Fe-4S binding protein [Candidatus Neomarinimicrobiota bacterium]